ncbi:MAG: hypothetical protein JWN01_663 [Patescibacteria group bacterium]|nr:hypothetical protein [Patescibacteria group bacterium]
MDYSNSYDASSSAGSGVSLVIALVWLALVVVAVVGMWKVFTKAGKPGWASLVPFYNTYVLLKIAGRPGWWLVLFFVPFVNIVIWLLLAIDLAKAFGKSTAFGVVGLWLFSLVGILMLGYGKAGYRAPKVDSPAAA